VSNLVLAFAGERVEVSRERAAALADFLWQGILPGAATSAAKLTETLAASELRGLRLVEFEPYETEAIRGALKALGVSPKLSRSWGSLEGVLSRLPGS
jgi:hypothetical protein